MELLANCCWSKLLRAQGTHIAHLTEVRAFQFSPISTTRGFYRVPWGGGLNSFSIEVDPETASYISGLDDHIKLEAKYLDPESYLPLLKPGANGLIEGCNHSAPPTVRVKVTPTTTFHILERDPITADALCRLSRPGSPEDLVPNAMVAPLLKFPRKLWQMSDKWGVSLELHSVIILHDTKFTLDGMHAFAIEPPVNLGHNKIEAFDAKSKVHQSP